jgi:uncharacterized repeat protein (TIGR01451 family)
MIMKSKNVLACAAAALLGLATMNQAHAVGTASGTDINNRAVVDFQVGGVAQEPIESSPTGNSTPGAGNGEDTSFVVDTRVDLTVAELSGGATSVNPGQSDAATAFTVANTGNATMDFALSPANLTGGSLFGNTDTIQLNNLRVFVDANGNDIYDPGTDTATFIDELAADGSVTVFVVADVPIASGNGDAGNIELTATAHDAGGAGALGAQTAESPGPDNPAVIEVVFGDAGEDGLEVDADGYFIVSAELNVQKTSRVVSDPLNGTSNPLAIPGAVLEYEITITNTGATDASGVRVTDVIDGNTTFFAGQYAGEDVEITTGAGTSTCAADLNDVDGDGCGLTAGGTLEVNPGGSGITIGSGAGSNQAVVRFQVSVT